VHVDRTSFIDLQIVSDIAFVARPVRGRSQLSKWIDGIAACP
jgi:hypothetical protein